MLAVLEDALATLQRSAFATGRGAARDFEEVRRWLDSDDTVWPCAFVNVCHVLGFDPTYLRRGLDGWLTALRERPIAGKVSPLRFAIRRISGSRTRAVVPRRLRGI
jgi:hypothetical protein